MNWRKFSILGTTTAASLLALPALASGDTDHWSIVTHYLPAAAQDNLRNLIGKTWVGGDTPLISHVIFGVIIFVLTLVLTSVAICIARAIPVILEVVPLGGTDERPRIVGG